MTVRRIAVGSTALAVWLLCSTSVALAAAAKPAKPTAKLVARPAKPVALGGQIQLEVTASGTAAGKPIVWTVEDGGGTVDAQGVFHAPATHATPAKVKVTARVESEPPASVGLSVPLQPISVSAKAAKGTVSLGGETQVDAKVKGAEASASGVKFELSGPGTVDEKGHYVAPTSAKTPAKATIKVSSVADPSKSAKVELALAAVAVTVKAPGKPVPVGGAVDLGASVGGAMGAAAGVTWTIPSGQGAIDGKGHFTAPTQLKTPGAITVKATSVGDPSKAATVAVPIAQVAVAISPKQATVELGGEAAFTAQVAGADASAQKVTWSVYGGDKNGAIDTAGHYRPPAKLATPAKVTIRAVAAADPSKAATVAISIAAVKLAVRAPKGPLALGGQLKLESQLSGASGAATGVSWKVETAHGGTVEADGTYRAPAQLKTPATVVVRATSDADPSKSASVSLAFPAVGVKLPAHGPAVILGGSAELAAEVSGAIGEAAGVTWQVQGSGQGTIDEKGRYLPPVQLKTPATVTVRATSKADPSKAATTQLSIPALAVKVSAAQAEVPLGASAKLTSEVTQASGEAQRVLWSVVGAGSGTIDADGTYHAPANAKTPGKVTVRATSAADPSKSAEATLTWPAVQIALAPASGRLSLGEKLAFSAKVEKATDASVIYAVENGAGTIAADGAFTAPALLPEPPVAKIIARAKADPSKSASATVELAVADGFSLASEQRISGGQPGAVLASAPSRQRVAIDEKRVVAVYNDGQTLLVPSSDDRGVTWRAPLKLLSGKFPITAPQLAFGPDHALWVAFRAQPKGQPGEVVICRTPDLQHAFDPCVKATGKAPVANLAEHALAVAADGAVYAAWHDGAMVTLARSTNRGVSWTLQRFPAAHAHGLALTTAADGAALLAFATTDRDTDELTVLAGKDALAPVKELAIRGAHLEAPSLAALDAQHLAVAYVDTGVAKVALAGGPAAAVPVEQGATHELPALALDGDGLQLAYREPRSSGQSIKLLRIRHAFARNRLELEPSLLVNTPGPAVRGAPSLAVDRAGRAVVVWTDGRGGDAQGLHQDLYAARVDDRLMQLRVSAPSKPLLAGESAALKVEVAGPGSHEVRWSIDDGSGRGSVDEKGVYTAPARLQGSPHVYVRATSVADPSRSAAALLELAPQPEIATISPGQCGLGEVVAIRGHHFGARYPGFGVTFGGVRARESDFVGWDDETISVRVPPGAKSGKVEVTAAGGIATAPKAFTFLPVELSVSPAFAVLHPGERRTFTAAVQHAADTRVTWRIDEPRAGQLSAEGTLAVERSDQVFRTTLRAFSVAAPERSATASVVSGPLGGKVWSVKLPGAHGPAVVDGRVIVTAQDGTARAYDREGKLLWSTQVASLAGAEGRPPQLRTPVVAGDRVVLVVQSSGSCAEGRACLPDTGELVSLDPKSGAIGWRAELGEGDFSDAVAFPNGVAVARYAGALLGFNAEGKKLWSVALPKGLSTPPVLGSDGLLHGSGDGGVLYAVSVAGKARPTVTFPGAPTSVSRPAVAADGTVYVASDDGQVRAVDARGQVRWSAALGGRVPPRTDSAPLLSGDAIYVATATTLEAFDLSGARRWKSTCGACSGPVVADGNGALYAGRYAPQAFASDGAFVWGGTDSLSQGERWSAAFASDDGLLFWTDAEGLSARLIASRGAAGKLTQR